MCARTLLLMTLVVLVWSPQRLAAQEPAVNSNMLRLALLRGVPVKWDLEANFKSFQIGLQSAVEQKAQLLITPECWLDGYAAPAKDSTPEKIRSIAQDLQTSPYLSKVAAAAKEQGIFICFGFTSLEHGKVYNAAGLWDSSGQLVGVYHKTHLQAHDLQYAPGESLPVWSTPWGKLGMMICADRRWPETARTLRLKGARLILNPTYGFFGELNEAMMRTRSYENQCFIAFAHPQQGLVTAPNGRVVAKENSAPGESNQARVLVCEIDLSRPRTTITCEIAAQTFIAEQFYKTFRRA
jgi:predicted amidohydrolase